MFLFKSSERPFDKFKLQTALKMTVGRLQMQKNKRENGLKAQRREIAQLLTNKKNEFARIKIEAVLRDGYLLDAFEFIALFCELLHQRIQLIAESKVCPPDLQEAASTLIWAAPRLENQPELLTARDQLTRRFGADFAKTAANNVNGVVNERVYRCLTVVVPEPTVCVNELKKIAEEYELDWDAESADVLMAFSTAKGASLNNLPLPPTTLGDAIPSEAGGDDDDLKKPPPSSGGGGDHNGGGGPCSHCGHHSTSSTTANPTSVMPTAPPFPGPSFDFDPFAIPPPPAAPSSSSSTSSSSSHAAGLPPPPADGSSSANAPTVLRTPAMATQPLTPVDPSDGDSHDGASSCPPPLLYPTNHSRPSDSTMPPPPYAAAGSPPSDFSDLEARLNALKKL